MLFNTQPTVLEKQFLHHLQSVLSQATNKQVKITNSRRVSGGDIRVSGGDINTTYVVDANDEKYFVKVNTIAFANMLLKEKAGLLRLRAANSNLKIPEPILHGTFAGQSFLAVEYLEKGSENNEIWQQLAVGLAQIHKTTNAVFGLEEDNYIGTLLQQNTPKPAWEVFYAQQRIMPLMRQAYDEQKCTHKDVQLAEQCCKKLSSLFSEEPPALLHGDLWSGNQMFTSSGQAAVYDPAVYFGHREMDIAMTLLFGGFNTIFYQSYNHVYPLQPGWRSRVALCQLYPLLVHLLLFGGHYYNSVAGIIKQYA